MYLLQNQHIVYKLIAFDCFNFVIYSVLTFSYLFVVYLLITTYNCHYRDESLGKRVTGFSPQSVPSIPGQITSPLSPLCLIFFSKSPSINYLASVSLLFHPPSTPFSIYLPCFCHSSSLKSFYLTIPFPSVYSSSSSPSAVSHFTHSFLSPVFPPSL